MLAGELEKAEGQGKKKVTPGVMRGWAPPKKLTTSLVDELDDFVAALPKDAREKLAALESAVAAGALPAGQAVSVPAGALLGLLGEFGKLTEARDKHAEKQRAKAGKAAQLDIEDQEAA